MDTRPAHAARSELERLEDQLKALDAWHVSRHLDDQLDHALRVSREGRLQVARRMDARRSEQRALLDRADAQLRESAAVLRSVTAHAVLAHRNAWFSGQLAGLLEAQGVAVTVVDDGAQAIAAVVLEQPDLVLVEDLLPTVSGAEVVARAAALDGKAIIGVQVSRSELAADFLLAGAHTVFGRLAPPVEVTAELLAVLRGSQFSEPVEGGPVLASR